MDPALHTSGRVQLVPLTPQLHARTLQAAASDRHRVIGGTHAVVRDGEVIGYASLGAVPLFFAWMHRQRATARDSFTAWQQAEALLAAGERKLICLPCEAGSPFAPYLARRGYETIGTALFNLKQL